MLQAYDPRPLRAIGPDDLERAAPPVERDHLVDLGDVAFAEEANDHVASKAGAALKLSPRRGWAEETWKACTRSCQARLPAG